MENIKISTIEMNTGGHALRVISSGWPEIMGETILEKENFVKENHDHLRRLVLSKTGRLVER